MQREKKKEKDGEEEKRQENKGREKTTKPRRQNIKTS